MAIMDQVRNFIDTHQVVCAGPFVYAYVDEVRDHVNWVTRIYVVWSI